MPTLLQSFRSIRRDSGLVTIAFLSLAFGIGATTAVFSIVNGVLLRPLPYPASDRLVLAINQWDDEERGGISPAEALDYAERLTTVQAFGVYASGNVNLTGRGIPERIPAGYLSHGVFPALGVDPLLGRAFNAAEDAPGGEMVVVLSHALWKTKFGGDSGILGKEIVIDSRPRTVIGIMPPSFRLPFEFTSDEQASLFLPLALDPAITARGSHFLGGVGRLGQGVEHATASAEIGRIAASFSRDFPDDYPPAMRFGALMVPMKEEIVGPVRPLMNLLLGSVILVLLIACANVANLLLVRAEARRRDFAVRSALGAGRRHLIRASLTETAILALTGGAAGVLIAWALIAAFPSVLPSDFPMPAPVEIDWRVLAAALATVLLCTLLTGLAPAFQASGADAQNVLREEGRSSTAGSGRARVRRVLVMLEIALALVLSLGAGLLLRTLAALHGVDPGFRTDGVLTLRLMLPSASYPSDGDIVAFYRRLVQETSEIPGIDSIGAVTNLPLGTSLGDLNFQIEGRETSGDEPSRRADWQVVTPGYFDAVGMKIVRGRGIEPRDDASSPGAIVLNESLARLYWPEGDSLGQRLKLGGEAGPGFVTVVGIVRDVRHATLALPPRPEMYIPHEQFRFWNGGQAVRSMTLAARLTRPTAEILPSIRKVVERIDPQLPIAEVQTLSEVRSESVAQPRFIAALFTAFSALALLMAAIGVYGTLAFLVAHRTREIGIRMALGARRETVLRMILRESFRVSIPGILLGLAGAVILAKALARFLYGVEPIDPATFAAVAAALTLVSMAASAVPALRATRVEPSEALRE